MIQHEWLEEQGILIVTPRGPLAVADFAQLARAVDPVIEMRGGLKGLMIWVESFPGWNDFAGLLSHFRFVRDHQRSIERVAAVTDSGFLSILPRVANHFVQAEVKHFGFGERTAALAWLSALKIQVLTDADAVAREAARVIAAEARTAVAARGRFVMAVSGGRTPWQMLRDLAKEEMPWPAVYLFQVDERIAPAGDPDRNLTHLRESLLSHAPLRPEQIQAMPVEEPDLAAAVSQYAQTLEARAGSPPVLDLAHLGMGPDGHTASLVPNDPVLQVIDADVALTGIYQKRQRMTLTYPVLNRARRVLWVVTGAEKVPMLARLRAGDKTIPAGSIRRDRAWVLADRAAAGTHEEEI